MDHRTEEVVQLQSDVNFSDDTGAKLRQTAMRLLAYPTSAVSEYGLRIAQQHLSKPSAETEKELIELPETLFRRYSDNLSPEYFKLALDHMGVLELEPGCAYACAQCYIDAPFAKGQFMSWRHVTEVISALAEKHRAVLNEDLLDVLIIDTLTEGVSSPQTPLDVLISASRHRRNRFNNFSANMMTYWRSNPTNWQDQLFGKHFGHVAEYMQKSMQIANIPLLSEAILSDAEMSQGLQQKFKGDLSKLTRSTSVNALISTVPYAPNSIQDQAVQYIIEQGILDSEAIRVSIPHPNLTAVGQKKPNKAWDNLRYTLRTTQPNIVYLFASNLQEFIEVITNITDSLEHSKKHWWIESRLAQVIVKDQLAKGKNEAEVVAYLVERLKRLLFTGNLEGRAEQFSGNPFFASKGTVMCINGVVVSANGQINFQACTTPDGQDLDKGVALYDIQNMPYNEAADLVGSYRLVNRARESVTTNLSAVPFDKLRRLPNWFELAKEEIRKHPDYRQTKFDMERLLEKSRAYLIL